METKKKKQKKSLENIVAMTIKQHSLIKKNDEIIVGFSGGIDSTALLSILDGLRSELGFKLKAIHFNFGLRGSESLRDERFARNFAKKRNVSIEVVKVKKSQTIKKGESTQSWARRIRVDKFDKIVSSRRRTKIAVAHNLDDQVENFFMRIVRGGGKKGLGGMEHKNCKRIRPLLDVSRLQIESYVKMNGLKYVVDSSNLKTDYFRNWIRAKLIPQLKKQKFYEFPLRRIAKLSRLLKLEDDFLDYVAQKSAKGIIERDSKDLIEIDVLKLLNVHEAVRYRIIRMCIEKIAGTLEGVSLSHMDEILDLIKNLKGSKEITISKGVKVYREYSKLFFSKRRDFYTGSFKYRNIEPPCEIFVREINTCLKFKVLKRKRGSKDRGLLLDYEKFKKGIEVRNFNNGDRILLNREEGLRKVKNIFVNKKIPQSKRREIPFVTDGGIIACIPSVGVDLKYRATENSAKILEITVE